MKNYLVIIFSFFTFEIIASESLHLPKVALQDSTRKHKSKLIMPSIRYLNRNMGDIGFIYSNHNIAFDTRVENKTVFLIEPYYNIDKSINGILAISKKFSTNGIFQAIEPMLSFKRFSFFKNDKFDYILEYNKVKIGVRFYFKKDYCEEIFLDVERVELWESYAAIIPPTEVNFSQLPLHLNRITYVKYKADEEYTSTFKVKIDNASYDSPLHKSIKFTKLELSQKNNWKMGKNKYFSLRLFVAYFLQNDNRKINSYNNEIARGSISLAQQGFSDYSKDENFVSRRNNLWPWANQISTEEGGGFKYAPSGSSDTGQSNDFAFAVNTSVNLPGSGKIFYSKLFFDFGGYRTDSKLKYLYSGGLCVGIKDMIALYLPIFSSNDILQVFRNNDLPFLKRASFSIQFKNHFTKRT